MQFSQRCMNRILGFLGSNGKCELVDFGAAWPNGCFQTRVISLLTRERFYWDTLYVLWMCTGIYIITFIYPWLRDGLLKSFIGSQANKNAIIYHKTVMAPTGSYWVEKERGTIFCCVLTVLETINFIYILTSKCRLHIHIHKIHNITHCAKHLKWNDQ